MLTPYFELSQTDIEVIILITAPYAHIQETELFASGTEFWFYSSPYYLRLNLPGGVKEDDEPQSSFNADKGQFKIRLTKETPGQQFPDLDLIGKLLAPKKERHNIKPNIEVLNTEGDVEEEGYSDNSEDEWFFEQTPVVEVGSELHLISPTYGFANKTQGVFSQIKDEFKEIVDLKDPESIPSYERNELRLMAEESAFSSDHYLADFMEEEAVAPYLNFNPSLKSLSCDQVKLTREELQKLKSFGNKDYLMNKEERKTAWLSLVDILYAFSYDFRTTLGENTVESAWTINKLSATLCWLQSFQGIDDVVKTCLRRSLCYPWCRNWKLSLKILQDTIDILKLGRRQILKCLLKIHNLFNNSEPRYLLNQLYITDYCIWLQRVSESKIQSLASSLEKVTICKANLKLELDELEAAAILVQQEEEEEKLVKQMAGIAIQNNRYEPVTDESSASSSDSESSSESDSGSLDSDDLSSVEE